MKKFIILSGSVDGATCEDDGFLNCANFGLAGTHAYATLEEAIAVRERIIETDVEDFKTLWTEEDGYTIKVGSLSLSVDDKVVDKYDKYIDVFHDGDVVNETLYKIAEVEL